MKGADLHPKTTVSNSFQMPQMKAGALTLEQTSTKSLWSDREKRLHINVLELKAVSLALQSFKDQCQNQSVLVAMNNSTVVAYINNQGGTHSAKMCALLWKIMSYCHHYQITLKDQTHSSVSECNVPTFYPGRTKCSRQNGLCIHRY